MALLPAPAWHCPRPVPGCAPRSGPWKSCRPSVRSSARETGRWGVDLVFECSGAVPAYRDIAACLRPGGTLVSDGMPTGEVPVDLMSLIVKEITVLTSFRYANV
ncbi:MAG: zinc-binding dehydrogenase [Salipiger thiooxidans]